jgi:hypothetical protein
LIALAHELSRHGRSPEVADFREYEALRRATLQDIRHPFRGLRRAIAGK